MAKTDSFTLIFQGDIRKFEKNPLKVETEFGVAYSVGVGDAFDRISALEELMEKAFRLLEIYDVEGAMSALQEQIL